MSLSLHSLSMSARCCTAVLGAVALVTAPGASCMAADATAAATATWENVSHDFTLQIGAEAVNAGAPFLVRCQGLIVTPTGDIFMHTAQQGICVSHDDGTTWGIVDDNGIVGRTENAYGFSLAYPYDGRMALFAYDGADGCSGGLSLDGGKTWKAFPQYKRGTQYGDVDWNTHDPQVIFAVTHEPFFSLLSNDGGKSWRRLFDDETGGPPLYWVGVVDAKTLVRYNRAGNCIECSGDLGVTWAPVAYFHVEGNRPVHYGKNLYWTTSKGVITSSDGKNWTLTGPGAEGALDGPYFGTTEQSFMVVTDQRFLATADGGKSWQPLAPTFVVPDLFGSALTYHGWDPAHRYLFTSGLGGSVFRLKY